ncbi:aminopeptidase [Polaromonas eurypsychrophila]|uniref:Aminopeptidase n=1 Tax=Polaromonas eurypsychrophila TaxID=1614635 RepID=A0A916WG79_9BURK|nr:aminopeptidase [Polaromonas eurypsychrophila]GGA94271.1 aminopeptidase [Polaromonas eurypsychrophila]
MRLQKPAIAVLAFAVLGVSGCSTLGYYWQSVSGHLELMNAARPLPEWLGDSQTPEKLKAKLELAQRIRSFAVSELHLPDNASYQRYVDLQRKAVVWNVTASPALSLKPETWCFPVAGCVGYRGYFDEKEARAEAARLQARGLDVHVYGVPAYSTLGWMNWAGGDPLLSTFVVYPEGDLARLIFHELAHQVVYVQDDTPFNESFATAVERLGVARWLAASGSDKARADYAALEQQRLQFRTLSQDTRRSLTAIYESKTSPALSRQAQIAMKNIALEDFRERYAELRKSWAVPAGSIGGYDRFVAQANNASFGAQAAYDDLVPGFETLFARSGGNWQAFYDEVRQLASLSKDERLKQLAAR